MAMDIGSIASEDSDIMKHGRRDHEVGVDLQISAAYTFKSLVAHFDAMHCQCLIQRRAGLIIFLDDL